jgi:uncharacterized membrane protein
MSEFAVVVFSDERKACEGLHALEVLHEEGSVSVYATAVVERHADGTLSVNEQTEPGALGFGVGALVGALIGVFAGPVGAAVGLTAGGFLGSFRDYFHAEVTDEFLASVERELAPGKFALVAEISEEWVTPLDLRMEALGGKAVRAWRQDFVEDFFDKRADAWKAKLEERRGERASAKVAGMEAKLASEIARGEEAAHKTAAWALKRLDETTAELDAKLAALEEQAEKAKPEVRSRIEQRIAELRVDLGERSEKLLRAYELAQEAIEQKPTHA